MNYIVEEKSVLDTAEGKYLRKVYKLVTEKMFWVPETIMKRFLSNH